MKTIKVQPLTHEAFAEYGSFTSITEPKGSHLGNFYNDKVKFSVAGDFPVTFSPLVVEKPEKMIIDTVEYHDTTPEGIMAVDDDMIVHVAPASSDICPELTEAFLVPQGTIIQINTGVWHLSPIPVNKSIAHAMIILPERIYKRDCIVINYEEKDQIEIVM